MGDPSNSEYNAMKRSKITTQKNHKNKQVL